MNSSLETSSVGLFRRTEKRLRIALAVAPLALLAAASVAQAQTYPLEGSWQYTRVNMVNETYYGTVVINSSLQAHDQTKSPTLVVDQSGYVTVTGDKIEIVFTTANVVSSSNGTTGYNPDHFYCRFVSYNEMTCTNLDSAGSVSRQFPAYRLGGQH